MCKTMFSSLSYALAVADRLAEVMESCGFDGWLINIENPLVPGILSICIYMRIVNA